MTISLPSAVLAALQEDIMLIKVKFLTWFYQICFSSNNPKSRVNWNNDLWLRHFLGTPPESGENGPKWNFKLVTQLWKCLRPPLLLLQQNCTCHSGISTFPTHLHIMEVVVIVSQKSLVLPCLCQTWARNMSSKESFMYLNYVHCSYAVAMGQLQQEMSKTPT